MASIDLVLPAHNEAPVLSRSVETVLAWIDGHPVHQWRVVIAENASTDRTLAVARRLQEAHPGRVVALHVPAKGRGIALRTAWLTSPADICAYMDVDLSTDIEHLPELVDPIAEGRADLVYGSRLHPRARTQRNVRRELVSRAYMLLLRHVAGLRVSDAQCGFKAISRRAARALVPLVRDCGWFFDSELLLVAQENGYRLHELPVRWTDDPHSSVALMRTAIEDLRGVWRLRVGGVPRAVRGREEGQPPVGFS